MYAPFTKVDLLPKIYQIVKDEKPDVVIQLGDSLDCFSFSRFPHDPNVMTPLQEITEGRELMDNFWKNVKKNQPKTRRIQIFGNHCARINKRILECLPGLIGSVNIDHVFKHDGVESRLDEREELAIDGVLYIHGHFTKAGDHMRYYRQSVVHGHSHRASLTFMQCKGGTIFELDCGHIADEAQRPMQYTKATTTHWVKSVGLIDNYGPRIILL